MMLVTVTAIVCVVGLDIIDSIMVMVMVGDSCGNDDGDGDGGGVDGGKKVVDDMLQQLLVQDMVGV